MKNTLKKNIDVLFQKGKWLTEANVSAIYMPSDHFEYMVTASKKKFKRAVDRNKIKRLLRDGISENKIKNVSIAFIYKQTTIVDYSLIKHDISKILNKL